ncbi:MAG: 6-hydroxycyclohex-1-ene-1-carbonyl-CoA dehydrogenase [Bdellovibrionales bacterium RBG_16_40_8]|nr:MAG: 6-hydroxycyclohex-1-ene-1-carbonyl-CoA dehydrogenase [Bdellovibrionales bacterium RBG_16_40_8]
MSAKGYYFTGNGVKLEPREFTINQVSSQDVVVAVAGCGLCHTDISFIKDGVKTKKEPPLILGHEISGKVIAAGSLAKNLINKYVVVPAVLPCGECEVCRSGRDNVCPKQIMPGNDIDGGFASHLVVPSRFLCPLPDSIDKTKLAHMSVVADAVTTPYQSLKRSRLAKGDLAIVIGTGGIGSYMVQHAKNAGARVVAIDLDEAKLKKVTELGAEFTIMSRGLGEKEVKEKLKTWAKANKVSPYHWKIFEMSGTAGGQNLAFALLSYTGTLGIVGFTMEKVSVRLSNIMAFDADIFGNWGCSPRLYPEVVAAVLEGKIKVSENVEVHPLSSINEVIQKALEHKLERRAVLVPTEGGLQ